MAAADRYTMATNATFQGRVKAQLYKAAVLVLSVAPGMYDNYKVVAAKKILHGQVGLEGFCFALVNDATFGPLVDSAGGNQATLTDNQIMAGCAATVDVFAAGQI